MIVYNITNPESIPYPLLIKYYYNPMTYKYNISKHT